MTDLVSSARRRGALAVSAVASFGLFAFVATSCEPVPQGEVYDRSALLSSMSVEVVEPWYADFAARAAALDDAVVALCEAPDEARLDAARAALLDARVAYARVEVVPVGPFSFLSVADQVDFWPADDVAIDKFVAGDAEVVIAQVDRIGVNKKGLPALEYLLHLDADPTTQLTALADNPRRCAMLEVLAEDVHQRADAVYAEWDADGANYGAELSEMSGEGIDMVVNNALAAIEVVAREDLGPPIGTKSGGTPKPESARAWRSRSSLELTRANLEAFRVLYEGRAGYAGLAEFTQIRSERVHGLMTAQLEDVDAAITAIPAPLVTAATEHTELVQAAYDEDKELVRLIKTEWMSALGVSLNFSDNDGD